MNKLVSAFICKTKIYIFFPDFSSVFLLRMEGEEGREVELAEVLRSVAGGVAMKCLADSGSNKSDKVAVLVLNFLNILLFRCETLLSTPWQPIFLTH